MKQNPFYYFTVFVTGAAILAIEIAAARALAPYFGTSMFVWANTIGVVLIALSLGYWWGGRRADRDPNVKTLLRIIFAAGVYVALIPILAQPIAEVAVRFPLLAMVFGSFIAIAVLFAVPVFLLGAVSPFVIRLATTDVSQSGRVAGSIYAFSTVGSIVGSFGSAFGTIPFVGTRETFFLASASLLLVVLIGSRRIRFALALAIPLIMWLASRHISVAVSSSLVEDKETPYQYAWVEEQKDERLFLKINSGLGIQSVYDPETIFTGYYYDSYFVLPWLLPKPEQPKTLILGLAAGTISRGLEHVAEARITGVEIDPGVIDLARKHFALDEQETDIVIGDARMELQRMEETFDLIIVDAYTQQLYIPFHLTTREFFESVDEHLAGEGVVAMNVNAASLESPLLISLLSTLRTVFPHVLVAHVSKEGSLNYLLLASRAPFRMAGFEDRVPLELLDTARGIQNNALSFDAIDRDRILTDNRAPVELLTDHIFLELLNQSL